MSIKDPKFRERSVSSAKDFIVGVQPALERAMSIKVYPLEDIKSAEIIRLLDQQGIDAFYYDLDGEVRGLSSRINYSSYASTKPAFTFRYRLWDEKKRCWDPDREYSRKLRMANSPEKFSLFPKTHVESFSEGKGSGLIGWSFSAETKDIVNYISQNLDDPERVQIFTPKVGERREVVSVPVEIFAKSHVVVEIINSKTIIDCRKPPPITKR